MKSIEYYVAALRYAANEAYQDQVIDTDMVNNIDQTKEEWICDKIQEWLEGGTEQNPRSSNCSIAGSGVDRSGVPKNAEGLLPCPFCGGEPHIEEVSASRGQFCIKCSNCWAKSVYLSYGEKWQLVRAWNTRGGVRF